eukprot:948108_1
MLLYLNQHGTHTMKTWHSHLLDHIEPRSLFHVHIGHSIAMNTFYLWSESLHYRIPSLFMCLHRLEPIQMFQYTWTHPHINYITFGTDCIDVHASNVINIGVFCLYFISVSIFISGAIRAIESCGCDDKDEQMNLLYFMIITLSY